MNRRELKAAMKAQRLALKASQRALRERVAQMPEVKQAKRRRRIRQLVTLIAVLLLLLFIHCDCGPAQGVPFVQDAGIASLVEPTKPTKPAVKPVKVPPMQAKVQLPPRDAFDPTQRTSPDWLDSFRLQVAARSPRLGECFQGTERPGALRWACAVNPESGAVSDQTFETVGTGLDLTKDQRVCLSRVLSSPTYRLTALDSKQPLPNRVGMVIEF